MKLSRKETDNLLVKLRQKYDDYARDFSGAFFNREEFERRLLHAQRNKMDISAFLLAEIQNFEKLRESFDSKRNRQSFSETVDRVLEEQLSRVRKYPKRSFHPRAGVEESHMYGALCDLADRYIPVIRILTDDAVVRSQAVVIENRVSEFVSFSQKRLAPRTEDHALVLSRRGVSELEIEKSRNTFLKESAFLLDEIIVFCEGLMENRIDGLDMPVQFSRSNESPHRKKALTGIFSSLTGYGALIAIKEYCEQVIDDFRLSAFRAR
ncbi:MAG: hypothetical protein ACOC2H_03585 [Spirochaetota bacterium]